MKKLLSALFLALTALLASPAFAAPLQVPLPVIASFSVLGDMVKTVGGDAVAVQTLVGPDGDAHTYQPTPDDVKAMAQAKLIFVNGLGLEGWMQRLIESSGTKAKVAVATAGIKTRTMVDEDNGKAKEITDPHAWQNLANGRIYIKNIAEALAAALPDQASAIKQRAEAADADIVKMDAFVKQELAAIPPEKRVVITSHDAFGYFGEAYGVKFLAPVGISTEGEASAADVAKLIKQMQAEKIKRVFLENMASAKLIAQIGKDAGAEVGGTLYSDSLSPADGAAPNYLAMFKNNVPLLKAAMLLNGK